MTYGPGMHFWVLDELMLGRRVAAVLDSENNACWTAAHDLSYQMYVSRQRELTS